MHSILPTTLTLLLATLSSASPLLLSRATCNSLPNQADRRGAAAVVQQLLDEANAAADRETGGVLVATASFESVAEFTWEDDEGNAHESYIQIRAVGDSEAEIARRNVYSTVMDLIFGCSNRSCADPDCPVSGEQVPLSNPDVEVRLLGNNVREGI